MAFQRRLWPLVEQGWQQPFPFLANMRINDILKYSQNNSYFTKPKERATKLNVLLNEGRTFWITIAFYVPFHERSNVHIIYYVTYVRMGLLIFYFRKRFERLLESELISEVKLQQNQKLVWETTFISCDFVNMTQKSIVFSATVRGLHVYKMTWKPKEKCLNAPWGKQPLRCFFY